MDNEVVNSRLLNTSLWLLVMMAAFYGLAVGRDLLIPLVLAIFIWYLVNTLADFIRGLPGGRFTVPKWLAFLLSAIVIVALVNGFVSMIVNNFAEVARAAPGYQQNLNQMMDRMVSLAGVENPPTITQVFREFEFGTLLRNIAGSMAGVIGNLGLILVYLLFIFLEQSYFHRKLRTVIRDEARRDAVDRILHRIDSDIRAYVGIKTFVSLTTALVSYGIMKAVGLDLAGFWAVLIFVFNFIPNIGSLVATALPSLLAVVQFGELAPFLVILIGVGATQLAVGNFIEPHLMGQTLNMSPLVIMLSLVLWGFLWGVPGMFLCVPITVIAMIILYHFDRTRWIALMLSKDGRLQPGGRSRPPGD